MTRQRGSNIAASIRQRLLNKARETDRPFNELLQYFAMERFLYRLSQSQHAEKSVFNFALHRSAIKAPESGLFRTTRDSSENSSV